VHLLDLLLVPLVRRMDFAVIRATEALLEVCLQGVGGKSTRKASLELLLVVIKACEPRIGFHRDVCMSIVLRGMVLSSSRGVATLNDDVDVRVKDLLRQCAAGLKRICSESYPEWWTEAVARINKQAGSFLGEFSFD